MPRTLSHLLPGMLLMVCACTATQQAAATDAEPAPSPAATTPAQAADATPAAATEAAATSEVPTDTAQVPRKPLAEADALYKSAGALFLDVRDAGSYASGHIKGAINIPVDVLGEHLEELPHDKPIIAYCA